MPKWPTWPLKCVLSMTLSPVLALKTSFTTPRTSNPSKTSLQPSTDPMPRSASTSTRPTPASAISAPTSQARPQPSKPPSRPLTQASPNRSPPCGKQSQKPHSKNTSPPAKRPKRRRITSPPHSHAQNPTINSSQSISCANKPPHQPDPQAQAKPSSTQTPTPQPAPRLHPPNLSRDLLHPAASRK